MLDLDIIWPGGSARFTTEDSPVRIGRSSEAAVPLTDGSVSRQHLELTWNGSAWTVSDSSTHGTFDALGIRLAPQWTLNDDTDVRLGGLGGVELQIRLVPSSGAASRASGLSAEGSDPLAADAGGPFSAEPNVPSSPPPSTPVADQAPFEREAVASMADAAPAEGAALAADLSGGGPGLLGSDLDGSAAGPTPALQEFDPPDVPAPSTPDPPPPPSFEAPVAEVPGEPVDPPASVFDNGPATPAGFDAPPSPAGFEAAPPGGFDASPAAPAPPAGFDGPEAPPTSFEAPPAGPGGFDAPPAAPAAPGGFEGPPAAPGGFDAAPAPPGSAGFDAPPAPPAHGGFDAPPAPPAPPGGVGAPPQPPSPAPAQPAGFGGPPQPPAGAPQAAPLAPSDTIISDATIQLSVDGQDYSFLPGAEVTVGRDPSCLVQLDERHSLVSRRHLKLSFRDNAWWLEDFSSKGTFVDDRQLKGPYKAEGAFIANLGDDDAGTPMRVITAGEHRVPKNRNGLAIAALAAVAVIPLAILGFILLRGGDEPVTDPDFASAKLSTVMLFGQEGGQGSGFFVDDNLIVTNQHVAALSPQMWVAVSRDADEPAQIEYATELVANHPFLDIAVLRITNQVTEIGENGPVLSNDPVGEIGLPSVTIGNSNDITLGDDVFSTGFPGRLSITSRDDMDNLRLPPVSATSGEAASFTIWPGCSNPDWQSFIPEESPPGVTCSGSGDVDRGVLVSTFSSGQGASGSAVFHNNQMVAVVFAGSVDEANASLNITSSAFSDWLSEIINANG